MSSFLRPTWCEIDLSAVSSNLREIRRLVGSKVAVIICLKGDAGGCGAIEIARCAEAQGVDGFAFGNVDSALACRGAGIKSPILLYPTCLPNTAKKLKKYNLIPTLSTLEDVKLWDSAACGHLQVFLKIDGGGFRAGCFPHEAASIAQAIVESRNLELRGVYAHPMSSYGFDDESYTLAQLNFIKKAFSEIEDRGISVPIRMASSSAIIVKYPEADMNAVDPGRLVMGLPFQAVSERQANWRTAFVGLKSRLVMVRTLANTLDVPSAPFFSLRPNMRLGLIPFGWSDGFPRSMPDEAFGLIRGKRVKLLGSGPINLLN